MFARVQRVLRYIIHVRRHYCIISPKRITISTILSSGTKQQQQQHGDNGEVIVEGWARSVRKMKDIVFIDMADGTGTGGNRSSNARGELQVTAAKSVVAASGATNLTAGCSLRVRGHLATSLSQTNSDTDQPELRASALTVLGRWSDTVAALPVLPRKSYNNDYLRQYLHLRHRTSKFAAVARLRDRATTLVREFMSAREFLHIHTPVLTRNDCEGAGETFQLHNSAANSAVFNNPIYLTVSAQLHLEAMAHGLGRVYSLNPAFRAENSRSRLHLSEFYMLEAEQAFVSDLSDLMRLMEDLVTWLTERLLDVAAKDIELASDLSEQRGRDQRHAWLNTRTRAVFPVLEYDEATRVLQCKGLGSGGGLNKEQELALVTHCGQLPTFVINWPRTAKAAFYMKESADGKVLAVDLLTPVVGEMAGGSVREDDYGTLRSRSSQHPGVVQSGNLDWYMDLRQFGGVPTAGFGLGFERYLQFLCNISNIKDAILFPRWPHNCAM